MSTTIIIITNIKPNIMKEQIKNTFSKLAKVPNDKLLHFFYGSVIATPLVIWGSTIEAIGFMIFISIGKEIIDAKMRFSPPNALDAIFTF